MNNLVEIVNNQVVVSSRQVAERFGKYHKDVLESIRSFITSAEFSANLFAETTEPDSYGRQQKCYLMNRDGFTLLAMGFTGKEAMQWKLKYIQAFNEMEAQLKKSSVPNNFIEALTLALEQAKALEAAKPKVEFVDNYVDKGYSISLRELGKKLGKRPNKFQERLRADGYLTSHNLPYQKYINQGLLEVKTVTERGLSQTIVTPKGVTYFAERYKGVTV